MTATLTLVIFFLYHHHAGKGAKYKRPIIIAAGGTILTLIVSHYKRRVVRCPLCIGTPLINTGALTHKRSRKFGPLSEGQCSILSIAMTQKFRCMYCGTRYDLLKIPRRQKLDSEESDV
jgi:DNA-directed RNA polymerase subunit RPC12/RpoP